eukprot:193532-Rhodomonas_salina.1
MTSQVSLELLEEVVYSTEALDRTLHRTLTDLVLTFLCQGGEGDDRRPFPPKDTAVPPLPLFLSPPNPPVATAPCVLFPPLPVFLSLAHPALAYLTCTLRAQISSAALRTTVRIVAWRLERGGPAALPLQSCTVWAPKVPPPLRLSVSPSLRLS